MSKARAQLDLAMLEEDLLSAVRALAQLRRWRSYHTHRSDRSEPGFPDLILLRGDRMICAELKREKGSASRAQTDWLEAFEMIPGAEVYLWRPSSWPEIEAALR